MFRVFKFCVEYFATTKPWCVSGAVWRTVALIRMTSVYVYSVSRVTDEQQERGLKMLISGDTDIDKLVLMSEPLFMNYHHIVNYLNYYIYFIT